jgi:hypothetical protein
MCQERPLLPIFIPTRRIYGRPLHLALRGRVDATFGAVLGTKDFVVVGNHCVLREVDRAMISIHHSQNTRRAKRLALLALLVLGGRRINSTALATGRSRRLCRNGANAAGKFQIVVGAVGSLWGLAS